MDRPIAGAGFALMLCAEVTRRFEGPVVALAAKPFRPRGRDCPCCYCAEYYRIIDRAWEAWQSLPGSLPMHPRARAVL